MYIRIRTITMKHSTKRRMLRLSISPTSPHREVANRLSTARLSPGFPGGLLRGCVYSTQNALFCQFAQQYQRKSPTNTWFVRIRRRFVRFCDSFPRGRFVNRPYAGDREGLPFAFSSRRRQALTRPARSFCAGCSGPPPRRRRLSRGRRRTSRTSCPRWPPRSSPL